jgi:hypothetical protein
MTGIIFWPKFLQEGEGGQYSAHSAHSAHVLGGVEDLSEPNNFENSDSAHSAHVQEPGGKLGIWYQPRFIKQILAHRGGQSKCLMFGQMPHRQTQHTFPERHLSAYFFGKTAEAKGAPAICGWRLWPSGAQSHTPRKSMAPRAIPRPWPNGGETRLPRARSLVPSGGQTRPWQVSVDPPKGATSHPR